MVFTDLILLYHHNSLLCIPVRTITSAISSLYFLQHNLSCCKMPLALTIDMPLLSQSRTSRITKWIPFSSLVGSSL